MASKRSKLAHIGPKWPQNGPKWQIFVFFEVLGAFRPPNSAKLFLGQPHYSALREKKVRKIIFFNRQWVQTPAKPLFIEIEIEKSRALVEKKNRPQITPKICHVVPWPLQCRAPPCCGSGPPLQNPELAGDPPVAAADPPLQNPEL